MRNFIRITLLLLLAVAPLALAKPAAQSGEQAREKQAEASPQPINSYKLDYAIYELENGKRVNARSYTLLLTDAKIGNDGNVKTGSRVPVATGEVHGTTVNTQFQYIDVGVNINANLEQRDGRLFLKSSIETTGTAPEQQTQVPAPVIRQMQARWMTTAVMLGKPMLLTSLDDVVSRRRYQVEVTVTKQ